MRTVSLNGDADGTPCAHMESLWPVSFELAGASASTETCVDDMQVCQKTTLAAAATKPPKQGKAKCDPFLSALMLRNETF